MTYFLAALALLAFGGIGWYAGHHRTTALTVATRVLLLAGVIAILMGDGPGEQVVAGGLVGLIVGDFAIWFTRVNATSPMPGRRTS